MTKIFSINTELYKVTGVQKVMMDIHHAIQHQYNAKIVGLQEYHKINKALSISDKEYIQWKNPFLFHKSIVIIHERKLLIIFKLLNIFLLQKIKIIYIHHNIFNNLRILTIMPQNIVSISDRVTENLTHFFKVPTKNIHKIHNTVQDIHPAQHSTIHNNKITILYPARINATKRQIEIYQHLRGNIRKEIEIIFVGDGPLLEELKQTVKDDQFKVLGFRKDIYKMLQEVDFMMLFSAHEGLPVTLIEAAMCGTPIICNDVGGNCEIAQNKKNAFVVNEWDDLIQTINKLPELDKETYMKMSQQSRKIYTENFTFDKFQKEYLKLIQEVEKQ